MYDVGPRGFTELIGSNALRMPRAAPRRDILSRRIAEPRGNMSRLRCDEFVELRLANDTDPERAGFIELASRILTRNEIISFLGNAIGRVATILDD